MFFPFTLLAHGPSSGVCAGRGDAITHRDLQEAVRDAGALPGREFHLSSGDNTREGLISPATGMFL